MGLHIIPTDLPSLTSGERKVLEKIRALYKNIEREAYLYIQPRIRHLEPDFILIDSQKGVTILEVKDWDISYIHRADRRKIDLADGRKVDNPLCKTNGYYNAAKGLFRLQDVLRDDQAELKFKLHASVIFPNLHSNEIEENRLDQIFNQPPANYISSDVLGKVNINQLFENESCLLEEEEMITIRTLLFPEIKVSSTKTTSPANAKDLITALDAEQERFAKRVPYGHYMVTGVPGSGKTVLLLARAIHLVREHPDWKIKILTYNKSLKAKIENKLNAIAAELAFANIRLENIDISTFHKFALDMASISVPKNAKQEWWNDELPKIATERAHSTCDAILVDEYQDFLDDWIRLCVKSCKEHTYINNKKETVTGINLFLAGDRLQSIYNNADHSWRSLGIDMRGRSTLLKKSYRSGSQHINLALNFLKQEKKLEEEVNKFYCPMNELSFENQIKDGVSFIEGAYKEISDTIYNLIYKESYKPEDILILCRERNECNKLKKELDYKIRQQTEIQKDITEGRLIITTYHSSKGLEAPIVFLVDVDRFEEKQLVQNDMQLRKLLYVGMTRSSERLYIHANSYSKPSFGKVLREGTA
ncbi:UvrD-helicase domain-containing protein [Bacillus sp. WLY-B-L8]|uniref:UvrD-helicase domain-containing protein n=1 Tax=Bacillus multifaciens TaxID=3068506 RepID=UPI0027408681|nr:nuclease-related domain-containing DEAD/DEAH box helicase [Bacillus sp. WLY-B-L8]MDP7980336.1 AAA family ATPase [Bacillus sp. WLY-B-L8]